jgi:hypothetical protein
VCGRLKITPQTHRLPRSLVLLGAVFFVLLALPAPAFGQEPPPPPPADPPPEDPAPPVSEITVEGPTTITLTVPPLPAKKAPAPKAAAPKPDPDPAPPPPPAPRRSTPEPVYAPEPEPEPVYSSAAEPEPQTAAPVRKAKAKPKPKPKVRRVKQKPTPKPVAPVTTIEPALPIVTIVEERRPFVAALPPPVYAPDDGSEAPMLVLLVVGFAGTLLLGFAGVAPRLAFYWPEVFVPVARERDAVSFFGLCLLASGIVAWAIVDANI